SSQSGAYRDLKIYIPGAIDTTRVVTIDYAVRNGVRFFGNNGVGGNNNDNNTDSYSEFYWNVTGNDWPVPIDHASAFVTLPENAIGGIRAQAFTGAYGSKQSEAEVEVKGADVIFETTRPLPMRGGATIDIYIPAGIIKPPSALTNSGWIFASNPILFLPQFTYAIMFALCFSIG